MTIDVQSKAIVQIECICMLDCHSLYNYILSTRVDMLNTTSSILCMLSICIHTTNIKMGKSASFQASSNAHSLSMGRRCQAHTCIVLLHVHHNIKWLKTAVIPLGRFRCIPVDSADGCPCTSVARSHSRACC